MPTGSLIDARLATLPPSHELGQAFPAAICAGKAAFQLGTEEAHCAGPQLGVAQNLRARVTQVLAFGSICQVAIFVSLVEPQPLGPKGSMNRSLALVALLQGAPFKIFGVELGLQAPTCSPAVFFCGTLNLAVC